MKFVLPTFSSFAYTLAALLLLGFSVPMVTPIFASNNKNACESAENFLDTENYQQQCQKYLEAGVDKATQAIRSNPKAEEPYYQRGNTYLLLGNYKAAVADYTEVIKLNTGRFGFSRAAYSNRARAYEKLGEKQKAISDLTKLIGNDSSINVDEYLSRARLYRDLGNKENAIADYKVANRILQQQLNGVFGNGHMDSEKQEILQEIRKEVSQMGVSLPAPDLTTRLTLQTIAKKEVELALESARFKPQHPIIEQFDAQLKDLYKRLANAQPQPYKGTAQNLVSNAAYEKLEGLEKERAQLLKQFTPENPAIIFIDSQINQLKILIDNNKYAPTSDSSDQQSQSPQELEEMRRWEAKMTEELFKYWFKGVEMAPAQEKFARAEHARYHQELKKFGAANREMTNGSFNSWLMGDGKYIWTGTKALEFEEKFLKRLESSMSQKQVQQVRERLHSIRRSVELGIPEQS
ncbi:MAG: tetratricopeptide repeat protein [Calothrix sp. FI2-JRJ7]|jgi:tetratricopeptide (TPR) repeat protein|nr:tetratricopeptide repeat protein [Calothrix sp. FI2-JRJ7]